MSLGETGYIEGGFGQSGKFRVRTSEAIKDSTRVRLVGKDGKGGSNKGKSASTAAADTADPIEIVLAFKRFVFDREKRMVQ